MTSVTETKEKLFSAQNAKKAKPCSIQLYRSFDIGEEEHCIWEIYLAYPYSIVDLAPQRNALKDCWTPYTNSETIIYRSS